MSAGGAIERPKLMPPKRPRLLPAATMVEQPSLVLNRYLAEGFTVVKEEPRTATTPPRPRYKFSDDETAYIVDRVLEYRCLWAAREDCYKDVMQKTSAWEAVHAALAAECSVDEVKVRFESIKKDYVAYKRSQHKGTNPVRPTLARKKLYEKLYPLDDHVVPWTHCRQLSPRPASVDQPAETAAASTSESQSQLSNILTNSIMQLNSSQPQMDLMLADPEVVLFANAIARGVARLPGQSYKDKAMFEIRKVLYEIQRDAAESMVSTGIPGLDSILQASLLEQAGAVDSPGEESSS